MDGEEMVPMLPWWRGFKGDIKLVAKQKYETTGIVKKINDTTVEITELPIHKWTQAYKVELEAMMGEKGEGAVKVSLVFSLECIILMICTSSNFRTTKSIMTTSMCISL